MAKIIVYGIPNCDTTKKTLAWLKNKQLVFSFHDYKQKGISEQKLAAWCNNKGWETIFNKKSTTWRALSETDQKKIGSQSAAIKLMMENNSIIKRPVIEIDKNLVVGLNEIEIIKQIK
jgi:arsenate reductase (glutaredoxin)